MKTETGCRPDQLFGLWAIEPTRFARLVELAKTADLDALRKESRAALATAGERPLYSLTDDGIAIVDLAGPLTKYETSFSALFGGTSTLRARQAVRAAVRARDVAAIMVMIDSPGGTTAGTADLADDIRDANAIKPTYAYAADLMASAALWIGSGARKVYANKNAEIGSIGVYAVIEDSSGLYQQAGVKVHVISSAPPLKGAGVDGTEITPAQLAEWERQVREVADLFVSEVATGRAMTREQVQALATGQLWLAEKSKGLGLIDGVISLDEAMSRLREEAMNETEVKAAQAQTAETTKALADEKAAREKAERELAETKARLDALETRERETRFAGEAKALGLPVEFSKTLAAIEQKCGADLYAKVVEQFKAKTAQVDETKLFGEKGVAGDGSATSASDQIEALAKDLLAKGKAKSHADAVAIVTKERPDLYERHVAERRK